MEKKKIYKIIRYAGFGDDKFDDEVIDTFDNLELAQEEFKSFQHQALGWYDKYTYELVSYVVNEDGEEEFDEIIDTMELNLHRYFCAVKCGI